MTTDTASASPALQGLQNGTAWYNLTSWTVNVTRYAPSFEDIVSAAPRMARKLGSFVSHHDLLNADGSDGQGPVAAAAAGLNNAVAAESNLYNFVDSSEGETVGALGASPDTAARASGITIDGTRGFGSVFTYATSKWALACIGMAVVLNRTHIYAATRRRLRLRWTVRLLLRFLPIVLITMQSVRLLQSLQCQTSPDFAMMRWGDSTKSSDLMFLHQNKFFNSLAGTLLQSTDEQSCLAVNMVPSPDDVSTQHLRGSLSRLWPLFATFCLSHFLETLSCAVQGRAHAYETAMTLFEQSLAFAEADAAVSNQLAWSKPTKTSLGVTTSMTGTTVSITKSMIMRRVNTPPEVLFVALLSSLTHISSHVLGVFDLQARYRLVNTGFWAFCFMSTLLWSAATFDMDDATSQGLLRYPTVCIIGLIPHALVLMGILICLFIYAIGLGLSALSPSPEEERQGLTFRQRLVQAHHNMQANVTLSEIRIAREMDIYTALLRAGFAAVTMASEAVYLNEDRGVSLKRHTWLEEARLKEVEDLQKSWSSIGPATSSFDQIGAIGLVPVKENRLSVNNGFSRERAAQAVPNARTERGMRVGVGATERSARWVMAVELFVNILRLFARLGAIVILWVLSVARIRAQPEWLLRLARRNKEERDGDSASSKESERPVAAASGSSNPDTMDVMDIEAEIRRTAEDQPEESLDANLYSYWLHGGWWGSKDTSGDYEPSTVDDDNWDATSMISTTTMTTDNPTPSEAGWMSEDEGQRTPTRRSPRTSFAEAAQMDSPLSMGDLARLLQPKNAEERANSRALAAHFQSDRIVTRSRFKRMEQLQRTRILTNAGTQSVSLPDDNNTTGHSGSGGRGGSLGRPNGKMSEEEEERVLEQLLLSRRNEAAKAGSNLNGRGEEETSYGSDGPHCVVCQCAPRAIIVWPCRCLSLCDDCRVSLAMNNFDKCVCCRREVMSFSRIYVP
ncbi:Ubiquitin-protein ligase [Geosmithia morbida]|uniref:Ubiquitin-protein ligase n=1 Tax=Geosmithia morbida TaxID=1094350 RepID=A0A9P5D2Q6_9HYPO|nr:Ubiquitin-protein ligase [Geosmithia morbida]KAF4125343.1 Ubiquitin-protein ligase [Geosmithia morbida]